MEMNQERAQELFSEGGTLVLLGMPPGTEFGIDVNSWNVGEKFKGVKMIPPGIHFVYFSAVSRDGQTAPRTGFFHHFTRKEVLVKRYDPKMEDLIEEDEDPEQVERIAANLQQLDQYLGPYPWDSFRRWVSLSHHISNADMERLAPLSGKICSAPELITKVKDISKSDGAEDPPPADKTQKGGGCAWASGAHFVTHISVTILKSTNPSLNCADISCISFINVHQAPGLPDMILRPGTEVRFTPFPNHPYPEGATPSEMTKHSIDSSYSFQHLLQQVEKPCNLLAEIQYSFINFLIGQVWEGWEQWRKLLDVCCRAEEALMQYPDFYLKLISIIHFQIQEVPEDLFMDIVEKNNFLAHFLSIFFGNVADNADKLPTQLASRAMKFKKHLIDKWNWNLTIDEDEDDAPVVVDLSA
ncbi:protein AAR2 homolog isoform X1 [Oratosquilla oratoria]|uniref:protein AAR2 homolog isoform X1 n=1 Tax=Oratosquilla oratoria TaxID=337810 RepID=UPI003F771D29